MNRTPHFSIAPYGYVALAATLVLSIVIWFLIAVSGDVHYRIEPMHHHLETFILGLLGAHAVLGAWFVAGRLGRSRR